MTTFTPEHISIHAEKEPVQTVQDAIDILNKGGANITPDQIIHLTDVELQQIDSDLSRRVNDSPTGKNAYGPTPHRDASAKIIK